MRKNTLVKILPYRKGHLGVGDGHRLYYECWGNPKGKPVLFLHGGPGSGRSKKDRRFFSPKKLNVVFFDQRGCGRSKPRGSLKANTTQKLVGDIRQLLAYLGIKKVFLFGGSWGSTLALCYAIKYPKTVAGMLLRGIFLASDEDIGYFFDGAVKHINPEALERFLGKMPKKYHKGPISYYFRKISSKTAKTSRKFAYEWAYYETSISHLGITDREIRKKLKRWDCRTCALIETRYLAKNCFLENGYILKNANKISSIPVAIVHGRYDLVCPPLSAYKLHKKIKGSRLFFTAAGHSASEKETEIKLIQEMKTLAGG